MKMNIFKLRICFGISDDVFEHILWGCTGFPCFWCTKNIYKEFYYQIRSAYRFYKSFGICPLGYTEVYERKMYLESRGN